MIVLFIIAAVLNACAAATLYAEGRPWWIYSMYLFAAGCWTASAWFHWRTEQVKKEISRWEEEMRRLAKEIK